MPTYEYKCETLVCPYCDKPYADQLAGSCCKETVAHARACGLEYEVFYTSISAAEREEANEACPKCGGTDKKRLISTGTSHILKGKGWYKDGY